MYSSANNLHCIWPEAEPLREHLVMVASAQYVSLHSLQIYIVNVAAGWSGEVRYSMYNDRAILLSAFL